MTDKSESPFGEVIHSYSRAQAIEDGVLVDVTETAKEAGFKYPVVLTRAVWDAYVTVPPKVRLQDERGRLWDIVSMLRFGMRLKPDSGPSLLFKVYVRNTNGAPKPVILKAICGPGDTPEPVITVMLTTED